MQLKHNLVARLVWKALQCKAAIVYVHAAFSRRVRIHCMLYAVGTMPQAAGVAYGREGNVSCSHNSGLWLACQRCHTLNGSEGSQPAKPCWQKSAKYYAAI